MEKERERERKREREEKKWTEWRVGSFAFAFGSVDIFNRMLSSYEQPTILEAQKKAKTLFFVYRP
jgi:hypothetical protein